MVGAILAIVVALLAAVVGVLSNWIPRPASLRVSWIVTGLILFAVVAALFGLLQENASTDSARLADQSAGQRDVPVEPPVRSTVPSTLPSTTPSISSPGAWAVAVEAACIQMLPEFAEDQRKLDNVDKFRVAMRDERQTAALIGGFRDFRDDYDELAARIEKIPLDERGADVDSWLSLFRERGQYLNSAATKIGSDKVEDQLHAITAFAEYGSKGKEITEVGRELGITSCP